MFNNLLKKVISSIIKFFLVYLLVLVCTCNIAILFAQATTDLTTPESADRLKPVKKILNDKQKNDIKLNKSFILDKQAPNQQVFKIISDTTNGSTGNNSSNISNSSSVESGTSQSILVTPAIENHIQAPTVLQPKTLEQQLESLDLEFYKNNYPRVKYLAAGFFDIDFYKNNNPDLTESSDNEVIMHWLTQGIDNGAAGSIYFDINYYKKNNLDLENYSNTDLMDHWIKFGYNEVRKSSPLKSLNEIKNLITNNDLITTDQQIIDYVKKLYDGSQAIARFAINETCSTNEQCITGLCDNNTCKVGYNQFNNNCNNNATSGGGECAQGLSCSDYGTCVDKNKAVTFSNYPITNDYRIKGILTDLYKPRADLSDNNIGRMNMNFFWNEYEAINKSVCAENEDFFEGHCYQKFENQVEEIKYYSDKDVIITGIVLGTPDWAMKNNISKCYKSEDSYFRKFCTPDNPEDYARFAKYLAHKFNGKNGKGRVSEFIIYNEVNVRLWWDSACGNNCTIENITSAYANLYNKAYDYINAENNEAVVLIPFEQNFFDKVAKQDSSHEHVGAADFILSLAPKLGNRVWKIAHHPYPPNFFKAEFSVNDYPKITFGNVGLLVGWLMQQFPNTPSAHSIRLTEQGINSIAQSSENLQASMLCETFKNIVGTPNIGSYNYHRMTDHVDELAWNTAMGLRNPDGTPKLSWQVWSKANLNTSNPTQLSCGFENLPYTKLSRYFNSTEGKHWATTREPPRYSTTPYIQEISWKLLKSKLSDTQLLFECRVSHNSKGSYISTNVNCDGNNHINYGPVGYSFINSNKNTVELYRCGDVNVNAFLTNSPTCELLNTPGILLGHVLPDNFEMKFIVSQYSNKYDRNIISPHTIRPDYEQQSIWLISSVISSQFDTPIYECKNGIDSMGTYLTKNSACLNQNDINYGLIGYIAGKQQNDSFKINTCKRTNSYNVEDFYSAVSCGSDIKIEELGYFNSSGICLKDTEQCEKDQGFSTIPLSFFLSNITPDSNIVIPSDKIVVIDQSINLGTIHIQGKLVCPETGDYTIKTKGILVDGSNAEFSCGTKDKPFSGNIKYIVNGDVEISSLLGHAMHSSSSSSMEDHSMGTKAIVSHNGGVISLNGNPGKSSYYKIIKTVNPGDTAITLTSPVEKWEPGDHIVVAPSGFNPRQSEEFIIKNISDDKRTITLDKPFIYLHWGQTENFSNGKGNNWTLDERAEVVNLTRNIKIMSDEDEFLQSERPIGAHLMVMGDDSELYLNNVEFYRVGQAAKLARYPVHWHRKGDATGQFIKNSSIHESFNRCIVVHSTSGLLIDSNTCYDHIGHGIFLEDGNEINNTVTNNITILTKRPAVENALLNSDYLIVNTRFVGPAGFWISNPDNTIQNNISAGSDGGGFWMSFSSGLYCNENICERNPEKGINYSPFYISTKVFSDNIAHSSLLGITHDGAPDGELINNPLNPNDREVIAVHYTPPTEPVFKNLVAYKNLNGVYYRGDIATYDNLIAADNNLGVFLAYDQKVKNSLIVGLSENTTISEIDFATTKEIWNFYGIWLYDGPFYLDNVHFAKFSNTKVINSEGRDITPIPLYFTGGAGYAVNEVTGLTFSPEPVARIVSEYGNRVWSDSYAQAIRDLDGSLGGLSNALVRPNNHINKTNDCLEKDKNALVCPYDIAYFQIFPIDDNDDVTEFLEVKFDVERISSDGQSSFVYMSNNKPYNNKLSLIYNKGFTYKINNLVGKRFKITFSSTNVNDLSPVVIFANFPNNCILDYQDKFNNLEELKSATNTGYYHDGTDLYVRTQAKNKRYRWGTRGHYEYRLTCQ